MAVFVKTHSRSGKKVKSYFRTGGVRPRAGSRTVKGYLDRVLKLENRNRKMKLASSIATSREAHFMRRHEKISARVRTLLRKTQKRKRGRLAKVLYGRPIDMGIKGTYTDVDKRQWNPWG